MAIYTPRGLKIRFSKAYAFALMGRLYPQMSAFRMLQVTEEVENLTSLATFIAGITVFVAWLDPVVIAIVVGTTCFGFKMLHLFGVFLPLHTILLPLSHVYSWFSGYGILLIILFVVGFFRVGWQGVVAFIVARVAATGLAGCISLKYAKYVYRKTGIAITSSERSFIHAYRLSADRLGVTRSIEVSDEEMRPENWEEVYMDLALQWPMVVSRFTED